MVKKYFAANRVLFLKKLRYSSDVAMEISNTTIRKSLCTINAC